MQKVNADIKLAIIIPYYKDRYIMQALSSIEQQTNKQFNVYIGDDCSPYPLQDKIDGLENSFKSRIVYHRFSSNLGSISLTKQWERCIGLSRNEPYIWLFSDDDIIPPDAVERFYHFILGKKPIDILRFDIQIIDDDSNVVMPSKPHPSFETAKQFLGRRLNGECISTACEYIFTRDVFVSKKGFVEFPLAWAADDASWANFAEEKGIVTISGNPVSWRMGGFNISSDKTLTYKKKVEAAILYLEFITKRYHFPDQLKMKWLFGQLSLLQSSKRVQFYFYNEIIRSKMFTGPFLIKEIGAKNYNDFMNKTKRRLAYFTK